MGQDGLCCMRRVHHQESITVFGFPEGTQTATLLVSTGREGEKFAEAIAVV